MGNLFNKKNKNKNKISDLTDLNSLSQNSLKFITGGKKSKKNGSGCGGIIPQ